MRALVLSLYVVLVLAAFAADDPGGWTGAKWGMTVNQVRAAVPDAQILTGPEAPRKIEGILSPLGIPTLQIGPIAWSVFFLFDPAGKLTAVYLNTPTPGTAAFMATDLLLTERYGRPAEQKTDAGRTSQWSFPTTVLQLRYTVIPAIRSEDLWLSYTRPAAARL